MLTVFKKLMRSLPFQLVVAISFGLLGTQYLSSDLLSFFLAVSQTMKTLLLFFLPLIIFSCVFDAISKMPRGAFLFIFGIVVSLCLSNFISTLVAYHASRFLVLGSVGALRAETSTLGLEPIWTLNLPLLIQNDWALLLGVLLGILNSYKKFDLISKLANRCGQISLFFLNRIFVPALPLFIFGFILKLSYDGLIFEIVKGNLVSVLSIVLVVMSYLVLLYGVAAKGSWPQFSFYLKNMFPPALTAFSTMSSAATLPLSIQAAEKNADHPDAARAIIPATVNIHLVGDSISIPMMAIMILHSFGMEFPAFTSYLIFAFYFVLSKFAVAGVPGGGILVMVPILEKYLGFTAEMSALITAFYILLDPLITTANVFGNNIFCVLFSKGMSLLSPSLIRQKFNSTRQGISETNPIK